MAIWPYCSLRPFSTGPRLTGLWRLFNNMCCEDKDYKPEEMEHFYEFIYQNFHKPSLIHQHKPYNEQPPTTPHTHRPWKRLSSTLKDRKEGTELGDLWVSFSRGLGRALVPHLGR